MSARAVPNRYRKMAPVLRTVMLAMLVCSGCSTRGPDTSYGSSSGSSLNGTGVFAGLLRAQGHQVRFSRRLTDELANWAQVIVRVAQTPGPPDRDEAEWYDEWLQDRPDSGLVYVVRDYDGEAEYWNAVLAQLPDQTIPATRAEAEHRRDEAVGWVARLPKPASRAADADAWFTAEVAVGEPATCKVLAGEWGVDLDPAAVALPLHQPIHPGHDHVLLSGDGHTIATEWQVDDGGNVLIVANGSFLLNLPMALAARRPLAERTAGWIGQEPRRIAFVSGNNPLGEPQGPPSLIEWITEDPTTRWVALHLGLFGLIACLARAPILGRPRPDPPEDTDQPSAHAEALGALLERTRNPEVARGLLATYRRWRHPRTAREPAPGAGTLPS